MKIYNPDVIKAKNYKLSILFVMSLLASLPTYAVVQTNDVQLIQHTSADFDFSLTKSNPFFSSTLNFDPFKYAAIDGVILSSTSINVSRNSSSWGYGYTPTGPTGFFSLTTSTNVDASKIGGPVNLHFENVEENAIWSSSDNTIPNSVKLFGVDKVDDFNQTFTPGGSGASINYNYGWQQNGSNVTWDLLEERASGHVDISYNFSIPTIIPTRNEFRGKFGFDVECLSRCYYDPQVATGYTFEASGTSFNTVTIPGEYGDGIFSLMLFNQATGNYDITGANFKTGDIVDLTNFDNQGLTKFKIEGIEASAGVDPADPNGFVTGFTFSSNGGTFDMTADVAAVPEPEEYAMLMAGLGVMGVVAHRRKVT